MNASHRQCSHKCRDQPRCKAIVTASLTNQSNNTTFKPFKIENFVRRTNKQKVIIAIMHIMTIAYFFEDFCPPTTACSDSSTPIQILFS